MEFRLRRFRRWAEQGVWDALLETLVELGLTDNWQHMIDTTTIRGTRWQLALKGDSIIDIDRTVRLLDCDIMTEKERFGISDRSDDAYPILARMLAAHRDNLRDTITTLERRRSTLDQLELAGKMA